MNWFSVGILNNSVYFLCVHFKTPTEIITRVMRYAHGRDYADGPRTTISRQLAPQVRKRVVFGRRRPESTRDNNRVGGGDLRSTPQCPRVRFGN